MGFKFYQLKKLAFGLALFFFYSQAWSQISLTSPRHRIVYQRNQNNVAYIPIRGNWLTNTKRIDARAVARDGQGQTTGWFTIATSSQNGQFQGSLPATGGWYNVEVRAMADHVQLGAATIERVGVGEVFVIAGHSVAQGQEFNLAGSDDERVNTAPVFPGTPAYANYENTANPVYLPRNFVHYSSGTAPAPFAHGTYFWAKTGQYLAQRLNVPILIFNAAFGGTSLEQWAKSALGQQFDHPFIKSSIGMPYSNVKNTLQLYISQTGIRGVLSDHGQNDWANTNEEQVLQYYQTWVNQARSDLNFSSLAVVVNRKTPFNNSPVIRRVQERMSRSANCFPGPDYDLLSSNDFIDGIHLSLGGTEKTARAWSNALNDSFFANSNPYVLGALSTAQPVEDNPPTQPANQPPVAPTVSALSASVNSFYTSAGLPAFSDPNNDPLTYSLSGLPAGLNFNNNTRIITGTPSQQGTFALLYTASDGKVQTSQNVILTVSGGTTAPAPAANFDGYLTQEANCATLSGWAFNRTRVNDHLTIDFFVGPSIAAGNLIGSISANNFRQHLKDAGKGNGEHWFDFPIPENLKDNQPHIIWARVQGTEFILKWAPKTIQCAGNGTPPPAGNAAPVAPALSPLSATINVDLSAIALPAFTDAENDPLTYTLTGLPNGLSFNAGNRTISGTPRASGTFPLTYTANDPSHAPVAVTLTLTVGSGTTPPPVSGGSGPGNYEGFLEVVDCNIIRGWVWDRNRPTTPIIVELVDGNTAIGTTEANIYRDDLKNAGKGNGVHGYSFGVPNSLKDGQPHSISGRVLGGNYTFKWAPKVLTCPSGARKGVASAEGTFMTVSPNPSRGQTEIQYQINAGQPAELHAVDLLGRSIWKKPVIGTGKTERETIDLSAFGTTNYLIQLRSAQQLIFKRLMIIR